MNEEKMKKKNNVLLNTNEEKKMKKKKSVLMKKRQGHSHFRLCAEKYALRRETVELEEDAYTWTGEARRS